MDQPRRVRTLPVLIAAAMIIGVLGIAAVALAAWSREAKLTAVDGAPGDLFGRSAAVWGDTAVVGAPADDDAGSSSGSVYVFVRSGATWTQQAKLTASDAAPGDLFGAAVALWDDTVLIGAPDADDLGSLSGAVYVYRRSGTSWVEEAKLTASDGAAGDLFGDAVGLSGDTAIVGATKDELSSGSAYVFTRQGSSWSEEAKLRASDAAAGDWFGAAVAVSGDTALIGSVFDDDAGGASGSAYVFARSGTSWSQEAKLTAADAAAADVFGTAVAVSADSALVGAPSDDDDGASSGSAYVFTRSGTSWSQQGKLTATGAASGDEFGGAVSLSGDTAVVGAVGDDDAGSTSGAAYVFLRSGSSWTEDAKLASADPAAFEEFGTAVGVSGETAVVGVPGDGPSSTGSAFVFIPGEAPEVDLPTVAPSPSDEGSEVVATATFTVGDPEDTYTCTVDPGDGSGPAAGTVADDTCTGPPHGYLDDGTFTVTVAVSGSSGDTGSNSVGHVVDNVAPVVDEPGAVLEDAGDQVLAVVFAAFSDPGVLDTHTCTVDYGDGAGPEAGTVADGVCEGPSHTYDGHGVFTVTVEVTDDDGAFGDATAAVGAAVCAGEPATIIGTSERDLLFGTPGRDVIVGLGGDDFIDGEEGDDLICGGDGADEILGGIGADEIYGDAGSDRADGGGGDDVMHGGDDRDSLGGGTGDDTIDGGEGNDSLNGDEDDDLLIGGRGRDVLRGGTGDDAILGEDGSDRLFGDAGDDTLEGGSPSIDEVPTPEDGDLNNGGDGFDTCLTGEVNRRCERTSEGDGSSIGDRVWEDTDGDGIQDPGESGASGVGVTLRVGTSDVASTTTDGDGFYAFTGLEPGNYRVLFALPDGREFSPRARGDDPTVDSDAARSSGLTGRITLGEAETQDWWDAGLLPMDEPAPGLGSIGDFVWEDTDGDGIQDDGEPGVSGVTVDLRLGSVVVDSTTTDAAGFYEFDGLAAGTYRLVFVPPGGYGFTRRGAGDDPAVDSDPSRSSGITAGIVLDESEELDDWDAGLVPTSP